MGVIEYVAGSVTVSHLILSVLATLLVVCLRLVYLMMKQTKETNEAFEHLHNLYRSLKGSMESQLNRMQDLSNVLKGKGPKN